ncbi:MAG TPA: hypothetical protein PLP19_21500 [bacterium]|nr:hypothetical protein [bacterium]HPN46074.1 hypothetical protein [bacterium]
MKSIIIITLVMVLNITAGFSQNPSTETRNAINKYLTALNDKDVAVRLQALKLLNDLKTLYPDYQMKEFDTFLSSQIMQTATKGWIAALASDVPGVRHSTLHVLVRLKSDFPKLDMSVFNNALKKMSDKDKQLHLQVDAKIAFIYLNSSELAATIKIQEDMAPGDVFTIIHSEMDVLFQNNNPIAANLE